MRPILDDPLLASIVQAADRRPIGLALVVQAVRSTSQRLGASSEASRPSVLATLREGLRRRALVVGSVADGQFVAWKSSPDDAIARIDAEWLALGRDPRRSEIASFATFASLTLRVSRNHRPASPSSRWYAAACAPRG